MLGLQGELPDQVDPDAIDSLLHRVRQDQGLTLPGGHAIGFKEKEDLKYNRRQVLPYHPNGMRFEAFSGAGELLMSREYYSVGGGFVVNQDRAAEDRIVADQTPVPHPLAVATNCLPCGNIPPASLH
jgi:L-serine dehydratase